MNYVKIFVVLIYFYLSPIQFCEQLIKLFYNDLNKILTASDKYIDNHQIIIIILDLYIKMIQDLSRQKRFYTEVAESIGSRIRNNIIKKQKEESKDKPNFRISKYAQSLHSMKSARKIQQNTIKKQTPFQLYNNRKAGLDKIPSIRQFKQKLKYNIDQSRSKREQRIHLLANRARQQKSQKIKNKQHKVQGLVSKKRNQVKLMKSLLEKSMEYLRMTKRQIQLQQTFQYFERRLKSSHFSNRTSY